MSERTSPWPALPEELMGEVCKHLPPRVCLTAMQASKTLRLPIVQSAPKLCVRNVFWFDDEDSHLDAEAAWKTVQRSFDLVLESRRTGPTELTLCTCHAGEVLDRLPYVACLTKVVMKWAGTETPTQPHLDFNKFDSLRHLELRGSIEYRSLGVSRLKRLQTLDLEALTQLEEVDLSHNVDLRVLRLPEAFPLTKLDLSHNTALVELDLDWCTQLKDITWSASTPLLSSLSLSGVQVPHLPPLGAPLELLAVSEMTSVVSLDALHTVTPNLTCLIADACPNLQSIHVPPSTHTIWAPSCPQLTRLSGLMQCRRLNDVMVLGCSPMLQMDAPEEFYVMW